MRTTSSAKKALKQAARGIMFLDAHGPKDWRKHVDLKRLLMQSCHDCVLGQLYTEFSVGLRILGITGTREWPAIGYYAARLGFDFTIHRSAESGLGEYTVSAADLTAAWRRLLGYKASDS